LTRLIEESRRSRRIIGQLTRGQDLYRSLLAVCQERGVRCAQVQVQGVVDEVELACYEPESRAMGKSRRLRGALQLLSATGIVAEHKGQLHLELSVVASRHRDNGIEVVGGVCEAARVVSCQFVMESLEDLLLRRGLDRSTGLVALQQAFSAADASAEEEEAPLREPSAPDAHHNEAPAEERETSSPGSGKLSWADAVMASVRAQPDEEEEVGLEHLRPVKVGDILDHQKFGRCLVQRVDADQEYVTVRLRNSRLVRLNLEVLNLRYTGEEDGHQVFTAAPQVSS
jgi:predicted DNA-binding protein with PD1-like motif